jgi:hypothetical protein
MARLRNMPQFRQTHRLPHLPHRSGILRLAKVWGSGVGVAIASMLVMQVVLLYWTAHKVWPVVLEVRPLTCTSGESGPSGRVTVSAPVSLENVNHRREIMPLFETYCCSYLSIIIEHGDGLVWIITRLPKFITWGLPHLHQVRLVYLAGHTSSTTLFVFHSTETSRTESDQGACTASERFDTKRRLFPW